VEEPEEIRQRSEASQRSLVRGGLPLNAIDRLQAQQARQGTPGSLFTSDLSVNELNLVRQAGYEPLGQVLGSTVYHVGLQWRTPNWRDSDRGKAFSYEMEVLTQGFYNARHLALGRMQQEATMLRATGVVGVRLEQRGYQGSESTLEFLAVGTAIRENGAPPARGTGGTASPPPFLSNLSGQDFWTLRKAGYRPVGLVVGNCAYCQIPSWPTLRITNGVLGGSFQNQELTEYSHALYEARSLAMMRLETEARTLGADGVVEVKVQITARPQYREGNHSNIVGMLYHITVMGTAIRHDASAASGESVSPIVWLR
jgi:uncharacterized protein YbjQ (UPF0145 family)